MAPDPRERQAVEGNNEAVGGYGWANCPQGVRSLVLDVLRCFHETLGANLIGFYLHGSLAMGCFNPALSDIDFLAVVGQPLTLAEKERIAQYLVSVKEHAPAKGIEMSVVLEQFTKHFVYPTPFELHYSSLWHERLRDHRVDFTESRVDTDLAAHFVVTRQRGLCLSGQPISEVFGGVPRGHYVESLLADAEVIYRDPNADPLYTVLNLPRVLAFLETGKVLSKMEAATWALSRLPDEFKSLLSSARDTYAHGMGPGDLETSMLLSFADHMKRLIAAAGRPHSSGEPV